MKLSLATIVAICSTVAVAQTSSVEAGSSAVAPASSGASSGTVAPAPSSTAVSGNLTFLDQILSQVQPILASVAAELPNLPELQALIAQVTAQLQAVLARISALETAASGSSAAASSTASPTPSSNFSKPLLVRNVRKTTKLVARDSVAEVSADVNALLPKLQSIVTIIEGVNPRSTTLQNNLDEIKDIIAKLEAWLKANGVAVSSATVLPITSKTAAPSAGSNSTSPSTTTVHVVVDVTTIVYVHECGCYKHKDGSIATPEEVAAHKAAEAAKSTVKPDTLVKSTVTVVKSATVTKSGATVSVKTDAKAAPTGSSGTAPKAGSTPKAGSESTPKSGSDKPAAGKPAAPAAAPSSPASPASPAQAPAEHIAAQANGANAVSVGAVLALPMVMALF
ncbi:hypothetical protein CKK34_6081 [Yarrowia sp. E02]|nr:hypothetical protein CKK34_6081 [Yarrowia sp. E02]